MGQFGPNRGMLDRALAAIEAETGLQTTILGWELQVGRDRHQVDAVVEIAGPEATKLLPDG